MWFLSDGTQVADNSSGQATPSWLQDVSGLSNIALQWFHTLNQPSLPPASPGGTVTVVSSPGQVSASVSPLVLLVGAGVVLWLVTSR